MTPKDPLFRKGSLIPAVLDVEADLIERERAARAEADNLVRTARAEADRLIEETGRRLAAIEAEERTALADSLAGTAESLEEAQKAELADLESRIEKNSRRALDHILSRLLPDGVVNGGSRA